MTKARMERVELYGGPKDGEQIEIDSTLNEMYLEMQQSGLQVKYIRERKSKPKTPAHFIYTGYLKESHGT